MVDHPLPWSILLEFERLFFCFYTHRVVQSRPLELTCRHTIPILPVFSTGRRWLTMLNVLVATGSGAGLVVMVNLTGGGNGGTACVFRGGCDEFQNSTPLTLRVLHSLTPTTSRPHIFYERKADVYVRICALLANTARQPGSSAGRGGGYRAIPGGGGNLLDRLHFGDHERTLWRLEGNRPAHRSIMT